MENWNNGRVDNLPSEIRTVSNLWEINWTNTNALTLPHASFYMHFQSHSWKICNGSWVSQYLSSGMSALWLQPLYFKWGPGGICPADTRGLINELRSGFQKGSSERKISGFLGLITGLEVTGQDNTWCSEQWSQGSQWPGVSRSTIVWHSFL